MVQQRASLTINRVLLRDTLSVSGDGASLNLVNCSVHATVRVVVTGGSTLSLASMAVPFSVWTAMEDALADPGSIMRFESVRIDGYASWGELTGMEIIEADGTRTKDPPTLGLAPSSGIFVVTSGCSNAAGYVGVHSLPTAEACANGDHTPPCKVTRGGRCVGRPAGYGPREKCVITVGGGGGMLGPCAVFDMSFLDFVTLPGGETYTRSDCPANVALAAGDTIVWDSSGNSQGSVGADLHGAYDCSAQGICGMPFSMSELGGGWELCFAGGWGCTNPAATNYDPEAAIDDGSCTTGSHGKG